MTLEACVAHAIHSDLDILEIMPDVHELPLEELEGYIENYIVSLQQSMVDTIRDIGNQFLDSKDAAGLCATCMSAGIEIPPRMLLRMCQTILRLREVDARFIGDTEDGKSIYYMKLQVA